MARELKGFLNKKTVDFFNLKDNRVFIAERNIVHMRKKHCEDYEKYYESISEIISCPDYIGRNPKDNSMELIKEFFFEEKKFYVKVAVAIDKQELLYAKTLYTLNFLKFEFQVLQGYYKKVQNL